MRKEKGGNKQTFKQYNRGLILKLIATGQCRFRVELSRHTGLTKMAVSNIVSELIEQDLVVECETEQNDQVGRNSINLRISPKAPKTIGVLIFRDRCEAILCDFHLNILKKKCIYLERINEEMLVEIIYDLVDTMVAGESDILGIGVASIGPVDLKQGLILEPFHFFGIKNISVVALLENRYNVPVFMDHDNQSGALAEKLYGNGKEFNDFLLLGISRGIGSGIILDGKLYCNQRGLAPEIGHVSIDYKGKTCVCGNRGCLEMYAATSVVLDLLRSATGEHLSFNEYCLRDQDPAVDKIFSDMMKKIAAALTNYVNMLNPDLILMGHEAVFLADRYMALLEREVNRLKFNSDEIHVKVRKPYFMEDAQLVGAACNVINQVFKGELIFNAFQNEESTS